MHDDLVKETVEFKKCIEKLPWYTHHSHGSALDVSSSHETFGVKKLIAQRTVPFRLTPVVVRGGLYQRRV